MEQRLAREAEERATWEKLAQQIESEKSEIATRLASRPRAVSGFATRVGPRTIAARARSV